MRGGSRLLIEFPVGNLFGGWLRELKSLLATA